MSNFHPLLKLRLAIARHNFKSEWKFKLCNLALGGLSPFSDEVSQVLDMRAKPKLPSMR